MHVRHPVVSDACSLLGIDYAQGYGVHMPEPLELHRQHIATT